MFHLNDRATRGSLRWLSLLVILISPLSDVSEAQPPTDEADPLARQVTIYRDQWGVAHILGKSDASTLFGAGYAQAEDYLWQLEDNLMRGSGRYAELHGEAGLRNDLLNRTFQIPQRAQQDIERAPTDQRRLVQAFARGINYYLRTHPDNRPRVMTHVEPWQIVALDRHFLIDFAYGQAHVGRPRAIKEIQIEAAAADPSLRQTRAALALAKSWHELERHATVSRFDMEIQAATGSNQWAVAGSKTASGAAMLLINPHQPWYGWGQFYEFHLHSEESLRFTGAGFFGSPIPSLGHNGQLGWTYTVNSPDIADAWREVFDDPEDPLKYRYGDGYRTATRWTDSIRVNENGKTQLHEFEFRSTHHGPIVRQEGEHFLAVRVARLHALERGLQAFGMIRAQTFDQWKQAVSRCAIPMFNIAYADRQGNIFYVYNGAIPIRDPRFDWAQPVDGTDPATEWQGFHDFRDLPQVENPTTGYVQNCNSSPFTTSHDDNPFRGDFPNYLGDDRDDDKRRAKMSRRILRGATDVTFESFQKLAYDTTLYWPLMELPRFHRDWQQLLQDDPEKAAEVEPYLTHLLNWNCRAEPDSTQTALCVAWYEELYGLGYPAETIRPKYQARRDRLSALVVAGKKLSRLHGDWKPKWGDVHRLQRHVKKRDVTHAAFSLSRLRPSLPCAGAPGPLGVVFTIYSTPSVPLLRPEKYAVVGTCYLAAIEFGERVTSVSVTPFGANANRSSDHYSDQSELFSRRAFKPSWFDPADVRQHAKVAYQPGQRSDP